MKKCILYLISLLLLQSVCYADISFQGVSLSDVVVNAPMPDFIQMTSTLPFTSAAFATDGTLYFCAATGGKLYKSTDFGKTASEVDSNGSAISKFVFIDSRGYIFWSPQNTGHLRRSVDSGANWTIVSDGATGTGKIWGFCESPTTHNLFMAGYGSGADAGTYIYKSTDSGATWTLVYTDITSNHIHKVFATANGDLYALQGDTIYPPTTPATGWGAILKSVDDGANWTAIQTLISYTAIASNGTTILIGTDAERTGKIYKSTNAGTSWTEVWSKYTSDANTYDIFWMSYIGGNTFIASVLSDFAGGDLPFLIMSTDNGDTWTEVMETSTSNAAYAGSSYASELNIYRGWVACQPGYFVSYKGVASKGDIQ